NNKIKFKVKNTSTLDKYELFNKSLNHLMFIFFLFYDDIDGEKIEDKIKHFNKIAIWYMNKIFNVKIKETDPIKKVNKLEEYLKKNKKHKKFLVLYFYKKLNKTEDLTKKDINRLIILSFLIPYTILNNNYFKF
ncbi:unnamed protein product, partial [marine sediment metagenome]